jgi:hypothetical protein
LKSLETWPKISLKVFGLGEKGGKIKMNRVGVCSAVFKEKMLGLEHTSSHEGVCPLRTRIFFSLFEKQQRGIKELGRILVCKLISQNSRYE